MPPSKKPKDPSKKRQHQRSFEDFYKGVYGSRWGTLKAAMVKPSVKVAMWNRMCKLSMDAVMEGLRVVDSPTLRLFAAPEDAPEGLIEQPPMDEINTPAYYLLDYASTMIVEQLQVDSFHKVLDLCAAPGGKSIAIAQALSPMGELTSNEQKADRCARLKRNLHDFIPPNSCVWQTTQRDATTWHSPEMYDRVLVDAPCSSERHLMSQAGGTAEWTEEVTIELARTQGTLLLRAIEAVKVGGIVVYSTCSISPHENDKVIEYAQARTRCHVEVLPTKLIVGEPTALGWIVLPDVADGWGPMYCCTLTKVASLRPLSSSEDDDDDDA